MGPFNGTYIALIIRERVAIRACLIKYLLSIQL